MAVEKGIPFPALTDTPNGPAQIEALAQWLADHGVIEELTTVQRDQLPASRRWPGRTLWERPTSGPRRLVTWDPTALQWREELAARIHAAQHAASGDDPLTPAAIGAAADDHGHPLAGAVRVERLNLSIPSTATTPVPFSTFGYQHPYGTVPLFSALSGGTVTVAVAGIYAVVAGVSFYGHATGYRLTSIERNGTAVIGGQSSTQSNGAAPRTEVSPSTQVRLVVGDELRLTAYQSSGGALALDAALAFHLVRPL